MVEYTKKLTIQMTDRVFDELQTMLTIKKISGGMYGAMDEFFMKMLKAIDKGDRCLDLSFKEERDE